MLKIKDNIDLKELEKYGFEKGYRFQPLNPTPIVAVVDSKRRLLIQFDTSAWFDVNYWYLYDKNQDKVYDLIKADLVEKVGDSNER